LIQHVSAHIEPSSGSHIRCLSKIRYLVPIYQYRCCLCHDGICRHNTDNIYNDSHIGTKTCNFR